jgi:hypothetical protein
MRDAFNRWCFRAGHLAVVGLFSFLGLLPGASSFSVVNGQPVPLSPAEQRLLQEQGFIVKAADYASFSQLYQELATAGLPLLVTTDAIVHATDMVLKYAVMELQFNELRPALAELTRRLAEASQGQWAAAAADELRGAALRNWAYFTIAGQLLGDILPIPEPIAAVVEEELALIRAHEGPSESPLFGYLEDYSAYDMRSSPPALQGYLQALAWYERLAFRLRPGGSAEALAQARRETLQALLITQALKQEPRALELWRRVYAVTTLFSGEADNLVVEDYLAVLERVYGPVSSLEELIDERKLSLFIDEAAGLRRPRLIPPWLAMSGQLEGWEEVAPGFSFLGWRFAPDDYVLQRLSYPYVGTSGRPRELPQALDLMAALGSSTAQELLSKTGAFLFRDYRWQLDQVRGELAGVNGEGLWGSWFMGLRSMLGTPVPQGLGGLGGKPWLRKELSTALAAWTLSRRKAPSFSEVWVRSSVIQEQGLAGGGAAGYVEPYPELYAHLAGIVRAFREELGAALALGLSPLTLEKLSSMEALLLRLEKIARKELAGESLDPDEHQLIREIGYTLEDLTRVPPPLAEALGLPEGVQPSLAFVRAAYTNYRWEQVLQEALGKVFLIEALVDGASSEARVVYGGVFSYYEFPQPFGEQLTGERWLEEVAHGGSPLPWWTEAYLIQPSRAVPFETVERGVISGVSRALERVIRDEERWAALWEEQSSIFYPSPPRPAIDFNREMVIAVFAGEQPTGGYAITVTEVKQLEEGRGLKVYYTVEVPGSDCFVEQLFTQPYHMIKLAYSEGVVVFAPNYEVRECSE